MKQKQNNKEEEAEEEEEKKKKKEWKKKNKTFLSNRLLKMQKMLQDVNISMTTLKAPFNKLS